MFASNDPLLLHTVALIGKAICFETHASAAAVAEQNVVRPALFVVVEGGGDVSYPDSHLQRSPVAATGAVGPVVGETVVHIRNPGDQGGDAPGTGIEAAVANYGDEAIATHSNPVGTNDANCVVGVAALFATRQAAANGEFDDVAHPSSPCCDHYSHSADSVHCASAHLCICTLYRPPCWCLPFTRDVSWWWWNWA